MKVKTLLSAFLFFCIFALHASATVNTSFVNVLSYSSTNVTTSAYVSLVTATPSNVATVLVCDTSTKLVKIARGDSGSQIDMFTAFISGCVQVPQYIPKGTHLWIKAVDATASSGYNTVSFLQQ